MSVLLPSLNEVHDVLDAKKSRVSHRPGIETLGELDELVQILLSPLDVDWIDSHVSTICLSQLHVGVYPPTATRISLGCVSQ